ncbi:hypothetical protein EDE15_4485 [Edaphobacter aggregans]|uniref:Uncharacterized protein n=1 Tax=Edaphobacter aggregans TaxID=570835 RepID=A0A428MPS8_9BACT|nr:hypothetical protein EDE15_4485 [Edaphobacter aggregans]
MSPVCFVRQVLSTLRGAAPIARRKGSPQSSALRLCRPPLRFALSVPPAAPSPRVGDTPPRCALLPPPSPGGVRHVGTCHAWHEKQRPRPRRKHHEYHQHRHPHQRKPQTTAATADRQRSHCRQREEPHRAARGRTQRRTHRLPQRDKQKRILLPVRNLQFWIDNNILLVLKVAPFDKKDGQLVPASGSCVDCPKRTGHNKLLFSDLGKQDACTDPTCYQAKVTCFGLLRMT